MGESRLRSSSTFVLRRLGGQAVGATVVGLVPPQGQGGWPVRRFISAVASGALLATLVAAGLPGVAAASSCTTVSTSKGDMTAAVVDQSLSGATIAATGCQIGVYYSTPGSYTVTGSSITNATYYGIFVDGITGDVSVDVTDSTISNIGDSPFDGNQYGVAVYYYGYGTTGTVSGTVSGNTVSQYQKGGIVVSGTNAAVDVTDNMVTGLGPVPFIAQNGIQFGYGASGSATGNTITGNAYSGSGYVSAGLLLFDVAANAVSTSNNHYSGNQRNRVLVTTQACPSMYGGVYGSWDICISN